jgi:hypothetical protein
MIARDREAELHAIVGWLDALEDHSGQAPPQVVDAVRRDYHARLRRLAADAERLTAELTSELVAAERAAREAADRRLELRLRYLVGELDAAALDAGLDEQEAAITRAGVEEGERRAALEEVAAFLARLYDRFPAIHETDEPGAATHEDGDDLGFLDTLPASATLPAPPPAAAPAAPAPRADPEPSPYLGGAIARTLITCRHCGTGSDPSLWYCDGCGAELG